jgi:tetratricopeptide (TPR) repeat protein
MTNISNSRYLPVRGGEGGRAKVWLRSLGVTLGVLVLINGALFVYAPALFRVDLAKGPYTEANNLELTRVYHRAIPLYERIIEQYPASDYAVLARVGIANSNIGLSKRDLALEQYKALLSSPEGADSADLRYQILARMAGLYRDNADADGFGGVFAQLEAGYPDSEAVREGRTYLEQLQSAQAAEATTLPDNFAFSINAASIVVPARVKVGEIIEITIPVAPASGKTPDFSLMTSLPLYQGFTVKQISPNPRSVADFWGRRAWQFAGITEPVEIKAQLLAKAAGSYALDLDIETNFDIVELGIVHPIQVED